MKYIHLNCLRLCLKSKIQTKVFNFAIVYSFKSFDCELCQKPIPDKITIKNENYSLIEFPNPETNYLILETFTKDKTELKYLYIIHMKDRTSIKIGRATEADVRITDISVSRNHADLKLINGSFYIHDNGSKFGTLVLVNNNFVVIPGRQLTIQTRKHFFKFKMNKTFVSFITCYKYTYQYLLKKF
jgi:hypothetical protein